MNEGRLARSARKPKAVSRGTSIEVLTETGPIGGAILCLGVEIEAIPR